MNLNALKYAVTSRAGHQFLLAQKHSPTILFGAGVVGVVGTVILASRATLQLDDILNEHDAKKMMARNLHEDTVSEAGQSYSETAYKSDMVVLHTRLVLEITKLYAPAIGLGVVSIGALSGSHIILSKRNTSLMAAYAAVEKGFKEYRGRVVADVGEEKDREYRYGSETITETVVDKDGKSKTVERRVVSAEGHSVYAKFFDRSNKNWENTQEYNEFFLKEVQDHMTDRLRLRGHLFLNEVYYELGMEHTTPGAVVGWRMQGDGDHYVDFGIWSRENRDRLNDFATGREDMILLDFNVDGIIYDKI